MLSATLAPVSDLERYQNNNSDNNNNNNNTAPLCIRTIQPTATPMVSVTLAGRRKCQ